jgi:signal transduction histidine kinase
MGQLTDDLLVFCRLCAQETNTSDIGMKQSAPSLSTEPTLHRPARQAEFTINMLPIRRGHSSMIRRAFTNPLSNAIKFTRPKEHVMIDVRAPNGGDERISHVNDNSVQSESR